MPGPSAGLKMVHPAVMLVPHHSQTPPQRGCRGATEAATTVFSPCLTETAVFSAKQWVRVWHTGHGQPQAELEAAPRILLHSCVPPRVSSRIPNPTPSGGIPCAVRALCEKLAVLHHREFGKFRRLKGRH